MCNSFVMEIERMEKELDHLKVVGYIFGQQNLFIFRFYGEMGVIDYEQKRNFKIWISIFMLGEFGDFIFSLIVLC